jgi:DNA helicase-2/ATP-dependent DNA helicase PcrA
MNFSQKDWQEEQKRVDEVLSQIDARREKLEAETGLVRTEVIDIRKHFWDDVSINTSTSEDLVESYLSMKQQTEVLSERERSYRHSVATIGKLKRLAKSPYFGRIDFLEGGTHEIEQVYLGIASFMNEDESTYLIYDWRAPISSLYYDYQPGPASYESPVGEIKGALALKRQMVIKDSRIQLLFDTGLTIGDELLQQALSRSSEAQMKSIVATIQKEQNAIIRNDRSRMLIVQGAAGSGKTSAALQRVAYLLYKHRETLRADQIVLFSPNPLFNSYVQEVLPELGEENMEQTTFQEYMESRLGAAYSVEDPFSQLEYVLRPEDTVNYNARISGIRFKSSKMFLSAVLAYQSLLERDGMIFTAVKFRGREIVSAEQLKEKFYQIDLGIRLSNRIVLLRDWLLGELKALMETEIAAGWVEDEIELLEPEEYLQAYKQLKQLQKGKGVTFDDFDKEKELLAYMVVHEHLKPLREIVKQLEFVDLHAIYRQLFADGHWMEKLVGETSIPEHWHEICRETLENLDRRVLLYEDATPYLFITELLLGFQTNTSIRHVVVDEAQDYSPFQLEFLKRLFPRARMTALGDINQAIYAHSSTLSDMDTMEQLYGSDYTEIVRLARSYRSTKEIVDFTKGMINGGEHIVPFERSGEKPLVVVARDKAAAHERILVDLNALHEDGYESIAIICKTAFESSEVYEALRERVQIRHITKNTPKFEKGVVVLPAYLAKGVEFDAVMIYDGSKESYARESERKLFYTACTRAMHQLLIYVLGEVSPFIMEQRVDSYRIDG